MGRYKNSGQAHGTSGSPQLSIGQEYLYSKVEDLYRKIIMNNDFIMTNTNNNKIEDDYNNIRNKNGIINKNINNKKKRNKNKKIIIYLINLLSEYKDEIIKIIFEDIIIERAQLETVYRNKEGCYVLVLINIDKKELFEISCNNIPLRILLKDKILFNK